jgi:HAD superfamily hydrolase (TIGR01549 family)
VVLEQLNLPALSLEAARAALLASLRFEPYPDAAPALTELRQRGLRLVVASNWDTSLRDVLARAGVGPLVDEVVTSAEVGARKPDTAVFEAALSVANAAAKEAVHVGDSLENDVAGAHSAGLRAVLLRRSGDRPTPAGIEVIASLTELPALLL